jgi:hypothetical protein
LVVGFIHKAMKPARRRGKAAEFDDMRANLNEALSGPAPSRSCGACLSGK